MAKKLSRTKPGRESGSMLRTDAGQERGPGAARAAAKAKVQRRRQIDPTTCEREYASDELEFMRAMEQYKRTSGRMFPTCSEVLEVVKSLGYVRMGAESTGVATEFCR